MAEGGGDARRTPRATSENETRRVTAKSYGAGEREPARFDQSSAPGGCVARPAVPGCAAV